MSAKQIAQIEKDLSLARAEIDRLVKELASVKGSAKAAPSAKSQKKTVSSAKKKAVKPAPVKAKTQSKKPPVKQQSPQKKATPAKSKSSQKSSKKIVGDFNDKAYLQVILKLATQFGTWTGVISALNAKGYVTVQGNPIPMNNFTRDLGRRLTNKNSEIQKLAKQIFAVLKK